MKNMSNVIMIIGEYKIEKCFEKELFNKLFKLTGITT